MKHPITKKLLIGLCDKQESLIQNLQKENKVVLRFGEGRLLISQCSDDAESVKGEYIAIGDMGDNKAYPINVPMVTNKGDRLKNWYLKMYFDKPESIDSLMHVLIEFQESKFGVGEFLHLKERISELERALSKFGKHELGCGANAQDIWLTGEMLKKMCDCGLTKLQTPQGEK
jgi:hypothetical protein